MSTNNNIGQASISRRLKEKASILILAIGILSVMTLLAFSYLLQIRLEAGSQKSWFVRERNVLVVKGSLEAELGHFYTAGINPQYFRCSWYQKTPGIFLHQNILLAGSGMPQYLKDSYPRAVSKVPGAAGKPITYGYDPNALPAAHCRDPWLEIFPDGQIFSQWNADAFNSDENPSKRYGFGYWDNAEKKWKESPFLKNVYRIKSDANIDSNDPNDMIKFQPSVDLRTDLPYTEIASSNSWYDGTQNRMASVDYLLYMNSNTVLAANPIRMPLFSEEDYKGLGGGSPDPAVPPPTKEQELFKLYESNRPYTVRSIGENWFGSSYSEHTLVHNLASGWLGTGYWDTPIEQRTMFYKYLPHPHFYVYDFYDVIAFGMWDQGYNNVFSRFANLRARVGTTVDSATIKNKILEPFSIYVGNGMQTSFRNLDNRAYSLVFVSADDLKDLMQVDIGAGETKSITFVTQKKLYVYDRSDRNALIGQVLASSGRIVPFMQRECIAMGIHYPYNALGETADGKDIFPTTPPTTRTMNASSLASGFNEPSLYWGNKDRLTSDPSRIKSFPNTWKITVNYYIKEPVVQTWLTSSVLEGWFGNVAKYSCRLGTCPYSHKKSEDILDADGNVVTPGEPFCRMDEDERQIFLPQNY